MSEFLLRAYKNYVSLTCHEWHVGGMGNIRSTVEARLPDVYTCAPPSLYNHRNNMSLLYYCYYLLESGQIQILECFWFKNRMTICWAMSNFNFVEARVHLYPSSPPPIPLYLCNNWTLLYNVLLLVKCRVQQCFWFEKSNKWAIAE